MEPVAAHSRAVLSLWCGGIALAEIHPFTWKPTQVVELTNAGTENVLLDLPSGPLRIDAGRMVRITAEALNLPEVKALIASGQLTVQTYKK
jgi:hypothetical protein